MANTEILRFAQNDGLLAVALVGRVRTLLADHGGWVVTVVHGIVHVGAVEFGELVWGEDGAETEGHAGVSFFDGGACVGDAVNLGQGGLGVDVGTGGEGFEFELLGLKGGVELDELEAGLEGDVGEALNLVWGEVEVLDEHGVLPEIAHGETESVEVFHFVGHFDLTVVVGSGVARAVRGGVGRWGWRAGGRRWRGLLGEERCG